MTMTKRVPENTAQQAADDPFGVLLNAMAERSPGDAIVAQEAAGQSSFVNSDTLPQEMSDETRQALAKAGVIFGDPVPGDDMFVYVQLPQGWRREGTSHNMHSELLDERGRVRAHIFYKAAFYDRRADINAVGRFRTRWDYDVPDGTLFMNVLDGGDVIFTASDTYEGDEYGEDYYRVSGELRDKCDSWLIENGFPKWKNAGMYWD